MSNRWTPADGPRPTGPEADQAFAKANELYEKAAFLEDLEIKDSAIYTSREGIFTPQKVHSHHRRCIHTIKMHLHHKGAFKA